MNKEQTICGIDEVGRGALAGPLVAAGVILTTTATQKIIDTNIPVRDSKKLTANQRKSISDLLESLHIPRATVVISTQHINTHGIGHANTLAITSLINKLTADKFVVDGTLRLRDIGEKSTIVESKAKADSSDLCVMLASTLAKITRDDIMHNLHASHPQYAWQSNVGYGTKEHINNIAKFGPTEYHRTAFVTTALQNFHKKHAT